MQPKGYTSMFEKTITIYTIMEHLPLELEHAKWDGTKWEGKTYADIFPKIIKYVHLASTYKNVELTPLGQVIIAQLSEGPTNAYQIKKNIDLAKRYHFKKNPSRQAIIKQLDRLETSLGYLERKDAKPGKPAEARLTLLGWFFVFLGKKAEYSNLLADRTRLLSNELVRFLLLDRYFDVDTIISIHKSQELYEYLKNCCQIIIDAAGAIPSRKKRMMREHRLRRLGTEQLDAVYADTVMHVSFELEGAAKTFALNLLQRIDRDGAYDTEDREHHFKKHALTMLDALLRDTRFNNLLDWTRKDQNKFIGPYMNRREKL